jgi:hypothetical protein
MNLGDDMILAAVVTAIVAGMKKAVPKMAGGVTLLVAGAFALFLSLVWMLSLDGAITTATVCKAIIRAVGAWVASVFGAWLVRNPVRQENGT